MHPLFSTKAFLIKIFKNIEEQVEVFLNVSGRQQPICGPVPVRGEFVTGPYTFPG